MTVFGYGVDEGVMEGDVCNAVLSRGLTMTIRCMGEMVRHDEPNCSCHIAPPCGNCVDATYYCNECGRVTEPPG